MSWQNYLFIVLICAATILLCRTLPLLLLKGKQLPERVTSALNLIPPAVFAALIANDLFSLNMFDVGIWQGLRPLIAAILVFIVGKKTKSLVLCIIVGVCSYALMLLV